MILAGKTGYIMDGLIFFLIWINVSPLFIVSGKYVGNILCGNNFKNYGCRKESCTGVCPETCLSDGKIWGTAVYTYDSPVCISAVHDFRISTWNVSERTVTFKYSYDIRSYLGSIRQGISTNNWGPLANGRDGCYYFQSPRVHEELLDIVSLHYDYLHDEGSHIQECHLSTNAIERRLSYSRYSIRENIPPVFCKTVGQYSCWKMQWNSSSYDSIGGYLCHPENSMLSSVLSITMSKNAEFVPDLFTVTKSISDNVTIEMNNVNNENYIYWYKDRYNYYSAYVSSSKAVLSLTRLKIGHAGIYTACRNRFEYGGRVRLIIRVCEDGKYGSLCEYVCPICQNGGICHDLTGDCICPPGFNGTHCENACEEDFFGKECNQQCLDKDGSRKDCSKLLFCLPDPYGCSCASGFKTLSCDKKCDFGYYGAGCTQLCSENCRESGDCHFVTGNCRKGCREGWHGDRCVTSYPRFTDPPIVTNITENSIKIKFNEWQPRNQNSGMGTPTSYQIQYKKASEEIWINGDRLPANQSASTAKYGSTITGLIPDTAYEVRVIIIDSSGKEQLNGIAVANVSTDCGAPEEPPYNITVDNSHPSKIVISWELPLKKTWKCKTLSTELYYNNSFQALSKITTSNRHEFSTGPFTEWHIVLRSRTKEGLYSMWSSPLIVRSAEDAPTEVRNLSVIADAHQLFLSWETPAKENGIIRYYIIKYTHVRWLHSCRLGVNSSLSLNNVSATVTSSTIEVRPSAQYEINVFGVTVKEGPPKQVFVKTEESVPEAAPDDFKINPSRYELQLEWKPPKCNLSNGNITSYQYFVHSLSPWDSTYRNGSTVRLQKAIQNLQPFTDYNISVFAMTKVGRSNYSAHLTARTMSDVPPAPTDLTVYHRTESILSLSWQPPYPPKGMLTSYQVHYSCKNECIRRKTILVSVEKAACHEDIRKDFHCATISNLIAHKEYTIQISARNKGVSSPGATATVKAETTESVPDPPENGRTTNTSETSLVVAWDAPLKSNGNITAYRINITAVKSYNESIIGMEISDVTSSQARSYEFQNLYPATVYNITIEGQTVAGYGMPFVFESSTHNAEPVIDIEPILGKITSNTAVLLIRPVAFNGGPISAYFIVVQYASRRKKRMIPEFKLVKYNTSIENNLDYYVAAKFQPEEIQPKGKNFTVGDGKFYNEFYNPPLETGRSYNLGLAVLSNYSGNERIGIKFLSREVLITEPTELRGNNSTGIAVGVIVSLLLLTITIIIVIALRYPEVYENMKRHVTINSKSTLKDTELISLSNDILPAEIETEQFPEPEPCCIAVSSLEEYVLKNTANGEIRKQFVSLEKGQCRPAENSIIPENKSKNRYGNLLSYDHSRVVLEKLPDDPYSDYINANYVDGYKKPKRYIATQGPKPITVADFWRMIWQENVCKVVMATNLTESGKTKCEKYWPETSNFYGEITVSLIHTETYADYVVRKLHINKENVIRELRHFHFTTWPDHGVPMYAVAVGNFIEKLRSYKPNDQAPILVHCSAGIGRTGTLILTDAMLDMAALEGSVDLITHLHMMRQQRMNIVETLDQYTFAYNVLVEILCREKTSILCSEYFNALVKLREVNPATQQTTFHLQFEKLATLCPVLKTSDCKMGLQFNNLPKNRSGDIIPPDRACVILHASDDNSQALYINAVYVNGYRRKDSFIVTQIPLPETVPEFWKMAYHSKTSTVILLNGMEQTDETCFPYWPEEKETYDEIQVHNTGVEHFGEIQIRTFELNHKTLKIPKIVKQFHLTNWMPSEYVPSSPEILLSLIEKVERWQQQSGATAIVQCLNGARACGLYCASVFVCDKIKAEQEVDVFLAVRSIRTNRPEFIENVEQYIYCHQVALTFLDSFEIYANFQ